MDADTRRELALFLVAAGTRLGKLIHEEKGPFLARPSIMI